MNCDNVQRELIGLAAGGRAGRRIEAHLASCAACREALQVFQKLRERIDREVAGTTAIAPPPALASRLRLALAAKAPGRRAPGWVVPAAASLAALTLALLLARRGAAPPAEPTAGSLAAPPVSALAANPPFPRPAPPVSRSRAGRPHSRRPEGRAPAVLVDPREEAGLKMFVADLSDRQEPDLGRLLASEPAPPGRLPDISIAPIEISELKFGESSTKERP